MTCPRDPEKEAARLLDRLGQDACAEARYRLTVATNMHDQPGIQHWSAISRILFEHRFGFRPPAAPRAIP